MTAPRTERDPTRRRALAAGVLYLITFVTSIPALLLYHDVLNDANYVLGAGGESAVLWGAGLEVVLGLAGIGSAVVLFPVLRRWSETGALGFVTARTLEGAMIFVGVVSLLSIVTLRQDLAGAIGAEAASLGTTGHALVAVHDWTFLLGPGLIPAVNAVCLGSVLYRSGLVPRILPALGLAGAPILALSAAATLFGIYDQVSSWAMVAALPIALWELSLGVYLVVKGFRPAVVRQRIAAPAPAAAARPVSA